MARTLEARRRWLVAVTAGIVASAAAGAFAGAAELDDIHDVTIADRSFGPQGLTVAVGTPVTWTNADSVPHTVTSDDGDELDSDSLGPGEAYGHVFEMPGTYPYHCEIHASMSGTVVVVEAAATSPGESEEPTPPAGTLPPGFSPGASVATDAPPPTSAIESPSATPGLGLVSPPPDAGGTGSDGGGIIGPVVVALALAGIAAVVALLLVRRRPRSGG